MSGISPAVAQRSKPGFATADDPDTIFELTKKIGKGGFGEVFKGLFRATGKEVALKIMDIESDVDVKSVEEEVKLIKTCDSPHVVKYYGSYFKKDKLWLAIEFCDAGSCLDVTRKLGKPFTEKQIRCVMRQVVSGVAYIHGVTPPICHRDIKAGNILLNAKGEAKLADFGISAQITATMKQLNTQIGSPYWMAPEVLSEDKYDLKVDIWSLGITAIELSQGKPPWFDQGALRALFLISTKPPPTLTQPENWSPEFSNFLECCLLRDPSKRWEARDLLNHPFLQTVDDRELLALISELRSKADHDDRDDSPPAPSAPAAVVVEPVRDPSEASSAGGSVSWMDVLRETKNSPKQPAPAPRGISSSAPSPVTNKLTPMPTKPVSQVTAKPSAAERKGSGASGRSQTAPTPGTAQVKSWFEFLTDVCGLSEEDAKTYANTFKKNDIQEDQIGDINTQILKDLGVKVGHLMRIMKGVRSVKHS